MVEPGGIRVTLPADVNQVDDTGYVWAFLGDADEPERVRPGAIIVAGDPVEPFLARVVDIIDGPDDSIVHLDVLGVPDQAIDELRHAGLLSAQRPVLVPPLVTNRASSRRGTRRHRPI